MNIKRVAVLGVALVAAIVAALLVRAMMGGGTPKVEARVQPVAMRDVLVAANAVPAGHALSASDVKWQAWPASAVDPSFISRAGASDIADVVKGTVARVPLHAGQPVATTAIVHGDAVGFMAAQLSPGMRAVSITISADSGAGGFILPNDRVDIILTTRTNGNPPRVAAKTILTDVRVLAVDQTFQENKSTNAVIGKTATLELTPAQAELIAGAESTGSLSLALRGLGDNQTVAANAPRTNDMPVSVIRYGISRPSGMGERAQ